MSYTLYVKTHNKTNLKYLGYTKQDPYRYKGSGVYWRRHLKVHGDDVSTKVLKECVSKDEVQQWGEHFSELYNVVESTEWANLKPETGDGGSGIMKDETKAKIAKFQKNKKVWTEKAINSRLENCLKNAAKRKGKKNPEHAKKLFEKYVNDNRDFILTVWQLFDAGHNKRQISLQIKVSYDRVKNAVDKRNQIEDIFHQGTRRK